MSIIQAPYPIDALPDIIKNAIISYAEYGQQTISLLANSSLSNVSLSCQGLANVARDDLLVRPISMCFITVTSSGERKTAADKVFSQGIKAWENQKAEALKPEHEKQKSEYLTWSVQRKAMLAMIKKYATKGADVSGSSGMYHTIVMEKPDVPLLPKLKYEDIRIEALCENLATKWPPGSIFSDEASIFLSSPSMQTDNTKYVASLNRFLDGEPIEIHRKTSQDILIKHRRFTLNLMMQPLLLQQMLKKQEGVNRHSGFLARVLLAYPESNIGNRVYKTPRKLTEPMKAFQHGLQACLEKTMPVDASGFKHIPTLTFEKSAKAQWIEYFNHIEKAIANPYGWKSVRDLASKASENIARLSALFHLFTASNGTEIAKEHVYQAYQIIEWHLNEAKRIFGGNSLSQLGCDVQLILKNIAAKNITQTTLREINRITSIRDTKKRDSTVDWLEQSGYLTKHVDGKSIMLVFNNSTKEMSDSYA